MKSLKTTMQKISLSDAAKEKMIENVKSADKAHYPKKTRRITGIVSAAAVLCFIAAAAVFVSANQNNSETITEKAHNNSEIESKISENTSQIHTDTKVENDNSDKSGVQIKIYDRIKPQFTPVKRISVNLDQLKKQEFEEITPYIRQRLMEKYGISPELSWEELTDNQITYFNVEEYFYFLEKESELRKKLADDGYCDKEMLMIYEDEDVDLMSGENIMNYCNIITMECNAYNDPDYELSDIDRLKLIRHMRVSLFSFKEYFRQHEDNIPDEVMETYEYEKQTYNLEAEGSYLFPQIDVEEEIVYEENSNIF